MENRYRLLKAFQLVMRPIARIFLRYGIGFKEFSEAAKISFVDVASSDYGIRGRPTNISRVAVMTGLTRKEVRRIRDLLDTKTAEKALLVKTTPMTEVLHHWHATEEFLGPDGRPAVIPFQGEEGSFTHLVKRFGGDVPAGAMRTELKRVGAIREDENGLLSVVTREFRPADRLESLITILVHGAYPLMSNIAHNSNPQLTSETWVHRIASSQAIKCESRPKLRRIAKDRAAAFAEAIDDVLIMFESEEQKEPTKDSKSAPIAVGVYYFEESDTDATYEW